MCGDGATIPDLHGTRTAPTSAMLSTIANLLLGRRRNGLAGLFDRNRRGGLTGAMNNNRGASALGTLATLAAPFVIRKLLARRSERAAAAA